MKTQATAWMKKVSTDFKSFAPGQKAVTIAAIAALIVGAILFANWKSQPTYAPLYSNMAPADAAAVVQELSDNGVKYKLEAGGTQILVPADVVYDTRLQMSSAGLPASSAGGYSLLDQEGITTSDFKQQVDFQRAIEGELAKTIQSLDGVTTATVHLAIPKQDVFNDGSKKPTAAVMVTTSAGMTLSHAQVQSIVFLVSSAVSELSPDDVTVADSAGKVLAAPGDDIMGLGVNDARSQLTQDYNNRVASAIQEMLSKALGDGHAVVTVNSELDFDQTSTTTQEYSHNPDHPPLWTEEQSETYTGRDGDGGTLGVGDEAEQPEVAGTTDNGGNYDKTHTTVTNALGTVTQTVQNTPGNVKKIAVAVLLDRNAPNLDEPAIQALVTSAVGLDTERGDTLAIQAMAFDTSAADEAAAEQAAAAEAAAAEAKSAQISSWIKQGTIAGLILLVFIGTILASKRRKKDDVMAEVDSDELELITHELPANALMAPTPVPAPEPPAMSEGSAGRLALVALADERPDEVARVLSGWLGSSDPLARGAKR